MKTRLYIWVTSNCNLACPYCIQEPVMAANRGYQMSIDEVFNIVQSCQARGLHFNTIELTGGEASMWKYLEEGVILFSRICDNVTLATNGNNPERILALGLKTWIVSASQATPEQLKKHQGVLKKLTVNKHSHKKMPTSPIPNTLPSICCTVVDPITKGAQRAIEYIRGTIWICPDACSHVTRLGLDPNLYSCSFEEDFLTRFDDSKNSQEICQYCLGNQKVWNKI